MERTNRRLRDPPGTRTEERASDGDLKRPGPKAFRAGTTRVARADIRTPGFHVLDGLTVRRLRYRDEATQ